MGIIQKIYDLSPIFIQNFMISISGYIRNKSRYGKEYYEHLKFLEEFDKLTIDEQEKYQNDKLISFVKKSYQNSKYLQEIYDPNVIKNFNGIEDLKKLPIIDKEMIRQNNEKHFSIDKNYTSSSTGGTTGKPLVVRYTKKDMMHRMAMLDHFKKRHGFIGLEMNRATFNGKHIVPLKQKKKVFWRYNKPTKQMIYSSFNISEENLKYYVQSFNEFKPKSIDGFFSAILDLANYIERHKLKLTFTPLAIFPTSETVTREGRETIERVFGCKVYDQYASSEGAPFITEDSNNKLNIELSTGVFEKLNDDSNEVLVTSFTTAGTPLIRFRIGDTMIFDKENKNVVKAIEGRTRDYLFRTDKTKINAGMVSNIFKDVNRGIIRSQVIQKSLEYVVILLEIDNNKYKKSYENTILNNAQFTLGKDMKIDIKYVDEIVRERSGKYSLIVNELIR